MSKTSKAKKKKTVKMCECGKNPATEPHTCPYASEINNDNEKLCTCCKECEHECAMDI